MDASTELNELWELLDKGRHEAWPECVCPLESDRTPSKEDKYQSEWWYEGWASGTRIEKAQHALDLVTAHAERWLVEQGWACIRHCAGNRYELRKTDPAEHWVIEHPLADAIRYALESAAAT
jgi:hypothetical protein